MQEMGLDVERAATAGRLAGGAARRSRSAGIPPLARDLAGCGDHRVQQDDHRDRLADHGRGEPGQRLGDQHHAALAADRPVHDLGVFRQAQRRVVPGDAHRDRLVARRRSPGTSSAQYAA
jgi:hypothetical protein